MYRPPQNSNRVKSIKNKFENIENNAKCVTRNALNNNKSSPRKEENTKCRNNVNFPTEESRSRDNLSKPEEDENSKQILSRQLSDPQKRNIKRTPAFRLDKNGNGAFQRNSHQRSTLYEDKVKHFAKTDETVANAPRLTKSKSSHDFDHIRSKFDNHHEVALLYTEPIPKNLRPKKPAETNIYTASTLKLTDLTDTLKTALKKPLPDGPAPKKPPRTFQHAVEKVIDSNNLEKNVSFLHVAKKIEKTPEIKSDPKYKLDKLKHALKNNKLRVRKPQKIEISTTTSGEDSDDSLLSRSKSSAPRADLNCFNGCTNPAYDEVRSSRFFVDSNTEEPVYAEPIHYRVEPGSTTNRNSLYYMSTPVLTGENQCDGNMDEKHKQDMENRLQDLKLVSNVNRQVSAEDSSLSSFASDMDSTPSPMDDPHYKIKCIIDSFENRHNVENANRVENLKNSLRRTLERTFNSDSVVQEQENETNVADIITKFQTYIKSMPKYCQPKIHKDTLFYCCLIVEKVKEYAQIKFKFPENADIPENIETLLFPEGDNVSVDVSSAAQAYSLLITNEKGERTFGYCRRVLPEGSTQCLPLAYCILSKYRAPRFYKKILIELESRHGMKNKCRDELISQFYNQKFPKPGESIKISLPKTESKSYRTDKHSLLGLIQDELDLTSYRLCGDYGTVNQTKKTKSDSVAASSVDGGTEQLVLTLHSDTRYEDADLKRLHKLPPDVLLKIFSSLLLERRVVLISSVISKLSCCVDSLQSILYPFTWHHTFIPILPEAVWDIVESPTPVICGVLSTDVVKNHKIENGIVVDLDNNVVLVEEGDETKILSGSMQKVWKRSIALANKAAAGMDYVHSLYLADAYLQVFVMCFKNYKDFIVEKQFQKEEFLKSAKTKGIRRFLKMFTETYMFHAFLDAALNNPESLEGFDKKIAMYGSEESNEILNKLLEWNR